MQIALDRLDFASVRTVARRLGQWWLTEFLHQFPERTAGFLIGRGRQLLAIAADQETVTLELLTGARAWVASSEAKSAGDTQADIDRFLSSQGLAPKDVDIGLRLPAQSAFCRQLLLPAEARDAIDAIVAQDLAKKTPFKPDDIYSDHLVLDHTDGGRITVWQWVVRRQYVEQAMLALGIKLEQIAFLVFAPSDTEQPEPFINLRREQGAANARGRKAAFGLCCSALVLALLVGGLRYFNQQAALDRLDAQITASSKKAQQVRTLAGQLEEKKTALLRLRLRRNAAPGLIDLWEEVSRVLPAGSFLTEFRLTELPGKGEEQVAIQGFSTAAANLVGIIDGSPLLFDAALTSPIAHDAAEGRERFALQAKVRVPAPFKEAAR